MAEKANGEKVAVALLGPSLHHCSTGAAMLPALSLTTSTTAPVLQGFPTLLHLTAHHGLPLLTSALLTENADVTAKVCVCVPMCAQRCPHPLKWIQTPVGGENQDCLVRGAHVAVTPRGHGKWYGMPLHSLTNSTPRRPLS